MKHTYKKFELSRLLYKEVPESQLETPAESKKPVTDIADVQKTEMKGDDLIDKVEPMNARQKVNQEFRRLVDRIITLSISNNPKNLERRFDLNFKLGRKWQKLQEEFKNSPDFQSVAALRGKGVDTMSIGAISKDEKIFYLAYSYETGSFKVTIENSANNEKAVNTPKSAQEKREAEARRLRGMDIEDAKENLKTLESMERFKASQGKKLSEDDLGLLGLLEKSRVSQRRKGNA